MAKSSATESYYHTMNEILAITSMADASLVKKYIKQGTTPIWNINGRTFKQHDTSQYKMPLSSKGLIPTYLHILTKKQPTQDRILILHQLNLRFVL